MDLKLHSQYSKQYTEIKTGPFGSNTSVDPKVGRKPGDEAFVDNVKALSQKETDSVDELVEHSETFNEPIHNV